MHSHDRRPLAGDLSRWVAFLTPTIPAALQVWGGHDELNRRSQLLAEIPLFGNLSPGELLQLATLLEAVCFEEEESIVEEGRLGDCMYVIVEGEPKVFVQGVGLVAQLACRSQPLFCT